MGPSCYVPPDFAPSGSWELTMLFSSSIYDRIYPIFGDFGRFVWFIGFLFDQKSDPNEPRDGQCENI